MRDAEEGFQHGRNSNGVEARPIRVHLAFGRRQLDSRILGDPCTR